MTRTPQQPPDVPDAIEAIERGPENHETKDGAVERPEMAVLRGIVEHRVKRPPAGSAPETVLNYLTEKLRRHPAWPHVQVDAAVMLFDTLFLLGVSQQAVRDTLGYEGSYRISELSFGSPRWELVDHPPSGHGQNR